MPAPRKPEGQRETVHAVAEELSLLDRVEAAWPDVVRDVRPHSNRLEAVLKSVHPVDVEGHTLVLHAASPFHKEQTEKPHHRRIIEEVLFKHVHERISVTCQIQQQQKTQDMREQLREVRKDPRYRAAINIFSPVDVTIEAAGAEAGHDE
ncbi:MAG: hypothetical protein HC893_16310 [Chloroflexaceae bacterium]|nr:hypothetical protein [Chloroflexaceae bacterium]